MKIFCVGRNFVAHALELNNDIPSAPIIFMKPEDSLSKSPDIVFDDYNTNIHYECELVIEIKKEGKNILEIDADNYIGRIGLGLDLTDRDLQNQLKKDGHPWELSKSFDNSAIIGNFIDYTPTTIYHFLLTINDEMRQNSNNSLMIFTFGHIIEFVSKYFTLKKGDLIFTGTPHGVGQLKRGDHCIGVLNNRQLLNCKFI